MSDDLIKRLRFNEWLDPILPEAADRIEQLERDYKEACNEAAECYTKQCVAEAKLAKAVAGLKPLVQICEMMRDSSGFRKGRYQHEVTDSQWSAWCKQIKTTRAVLAELEKENG